MIDEDFAKTTFIIGLVLGVILTMVFWSIVADQVELSKVSDGYLTYKSKTYSVTLYDTLDAPEKKE